MKCCYRPNKIDTDIAQEVLRCKVGCEANALSYQPTETHSNLYISRQVYEKQKVESGDHHIYKQVRAYDPESDVIAKAIMAYFSSKFRAELVEYPVIRLQQETRRETRVSTIHYPPDVETQSPQVEVSRSSTSANQEACRTSSGVSDDNIYFSYAYKTPPSAQSTFSLRAYPLCNSSEYNVASYRVAYLFAENQKLAAQLKHNSAFYSVGRLVSTVCYRLMQYITQFQYAMTGKCATTLKQLNDIETYVVETTNLRLELKYTIKQLERAHYENADLRRQIDELHNVLELRIAEQPKKQEENEFSSFLVRQQKAHALTVYAYQQRISALETQVKFLRDRALDDRTNQMWQSTMELDNYSLKKQLGAIRQQEYQVIMETSSLHGELLGPEYRGIVDQSAYKLISVLRQANADLLERNQELEAYLEMMCGIGPSNAIR